MLCLLYASSRLSTERRKAHLPVLRQSRPHIAPVLQRRCEQGQNTNEGSPPAGKRARGVNDMHEEVLARNSMLRSVPGGEKSNGQNETEPQLVLGSGATAHMISEDIAELVADTELRDIN